MLGVSLTLHYLGRGHVHFQLSESAPDTVARTEAEREMSESRYGCLPLPTSASQPPLGQEVMWLPEVSVADRRSLTADSNSCLVGKTKDGRGDGGESGGRGERERGERGRERMNE